MAGAVRVSMLNSDIYHYSETKDMLLYISIKWINLNWKH